MESSAVFEQNMQTAQERSANFLQALVEDLENWRLNKI